jgi:hypothetical protein
VFFSDEPIATALAIVGHDEFTWARVYDINEFLGGAKAIATAGFASEKESARVRQTANHYRHLGKAKPARLSPNPPTLLEAILFATGLMKQWIAQRI